MSQSLEKNWKTLKELDSKNMSKSALEKAEEIYLQAKDSQQGDQRIKALLYVLKYQQVLEEGSDTLIIKRIKEEIHWANSPEKEILHSYLADIYSQLLQRDRYKIAGRTQIEEASEDVLSWDLRTFYEQITQAYAASLANKVLLVNTEARAYEALLDTEAGSLTYRPTLYDILAHKAISFFANVNNGLPEPPEPFRLTVETAFAPTESFLRERFPTEEEDNRLRKAIMIFQELAAYHQASTQQIRPLIDVEMKRLAFANRYARGTQKDEKYLAALESLLEKAAKDPIAAEVRYLIAEKWADQASQYTAGAEETYRYHKQKAKAYADETIKLFPGTRGAKLANNLVQDILKRSLKVEVENVNSVDQAFRVYLDYRNFDQVYLRIIPAKLEWLFEYDSEKEIDRLLKIPAVEAWSTKLNGSEDYQLHNTEIAAPGLRSGTYVVLVSSTPDFDKKTSQFSRAYFQVSQLSLFTRQSLNTDLEVFITDRESGEPQQGASVQLQKRKEYNDPFTNWGKVYETDQDGKATISLEGRGDTYQIRCSHQGDTYTFLPDYYYKYQPSAEKARKVAYLFTDRRMYRPGQPVNVKVLLLEEEGKSLKILPNTSLTVKLYDVNYQEVSYIDVRTNAYGSASGLFTLPRGILTGSMRISTPHGSTSIQVEEYKRPNFSVSILPIEGTYGLNDSVSVSAKAETYSGIPLSGGAKVSYKVEREPFSPYGGYWRIYPPISALPYPSEGRQIITTGETEVDNEGNIQFDFITKADESGQIEERLFFKYTINVEVTDISGETHVGTTYIKAGNKPYVANWKLPELINNLSENIQLVAQNLSDQPVELSGIMKVYKLKEPDQLLRKRRWDKVDQPTLSLEEFKKIFPHDIYANEDSPTSWEEGELILQQEITSNTPISIESLEGKDPGRYKFIFIPEGDELRETISFSMLDEGNSKVWPKNELVGYKLSQTSAEPGETVSLSIGSFEKNTWVLYMLLQGKDILESKWIKLKKYRETIEIPIKESYRGDIHLHLIAGKHNDIVEKYATIEVPYTHKQLSFSWEQMRSTLIPGEEVKWTLRIHNHKDKPIPAEVLATMYDASLDAFLPHSFGLNLYYPIGHAYYFNTEKGYLTYSGQNDQFFSWGNYEMVDPKGYDQLERMPFMGGASYAGGRPLRARALRAESAGRQMEDTVVLDVAASQAPDEYMAKSEAVGEEDEGILANFNTFPPSPEDPSSSTDLEAVPLRKNLQETAFFYPHLQADENGDVLIAFTAPEALTGWKFLGLAHTQELATGIIEAKAVTQKDLMMQPLLPRFMREGDEVVLVGKIANQSAESMKGKASLTLLNAYDLQPLNLLAEGEAKEIAFEAEAELSTTVRWKVAVPEGLEAIIIQMRASDGTYTDGEEHMLPILSNRMLVTETLPMAVRGNQQKTFSLNKLLNADSPTLQHKKLSLELTGNPAWYAVQALPYLMEYPYECTEQIYSRYYANTLASHIANASPRIQQVFTQWSQSAKEVDKTTFISNLEKNQELKAILLEATPWVLEAKDETERKQRLGILFDLNRMSSESSRALSQLSERQNTDGSFSWFPGMRPSRYITQLIAIGLGHLQKMGVSTSGNPEISRMGEKAATWLDTQILKDYQELKRLKVDLNKNHLGYTQIQYLYMRSFYGELSFGRNTEEAWKYYYGQAESFWPQQSKYMQGMLSMTFHRNEATSLAEEVLTSLEENAIYSEEMGMYWKDISNGYYWYQAPIETQSLLIEAFGETGKHLKEVEEMKIWLLKNKQTNDWKTTRATVAACNALLMSGTNWLDNSSSLKVTVGNEQIDLAKTAGLQPEVGTGYSKINWDGGEVSPEMGKVTLQKVGDGIAWGGLYWQYMEDLDKITFAETPLKVEKEMMLVKETDQGQILEKIDQQALKSGDRLRARIVIRVDRAMEYVHMKDMRAAGLEPVDVLSKYNWKSGLGWYQSTKDAATHFFFEYLPKGTHVFEYDLRATLSGDFSNGLTTIQCMYAPEFSSHTAGIRIKIE
ncbi:MAG: alpha-2-macroglobulin family protein [Bacteroidota bacterium]